VKTTWAIFRRELAAFFNSALAYIAIPLFLLLVGLFSLYLDDLFDKNLAHMGSVFRWMALFLILLVPALTMRMLAEERRSGSLELLQTLPVSDAQIVLGLMSASYCAIGLAVSAFTRSQILAFLLAMALCLVPYSMGFFLEQVPSDWVVVVQHLSFETHFSSLSRGVLDTRNMVFYFSVVIVALHVAVFALEESRSRA
jgi:ABC-2 type transport system permease protein